MSTATTRYRILDAAEKLFSERGISDTSVRAISAEAGVNVASMNYHFGSKDSLIDSVFSRRLEPLNQERLSLLHKLESHDGHPGLTLERILEAFFGPALRLARDRGGENLMRLMGQAHSESREFYENHIAKHFSEVFERFLGALGKVLREIPRKELLWKMHFAIGAMAYTMVHTSAARRDDLRVFEDVDQRGRSASGFVELEDVESLLERLVCFTAAGFRAERRLRDKEGEES